MLTFTPNFKHKHTELLSLSENLLTELISTKNSSGIVNKLNPVTHDMTIYFLSSTIFGRTWKRQKYPPQMYSEI